MKKLTRCLLCITLSLFLHAAVAQDSLAYVLYPHELNDTVSLYIKHLRAGITDTIIRFDLPDHHDGDRPANEYASHNSTHPNISYIFYRSAGKTYVVHYTWLGRQYNKGHQYMSEPDYIPGDTLFTWFARHIKTIWDEDIYPFMIKDQQEGATRYLPWRPLYSPVYRLSFYTPDDRIVKRLSAEDMQKQNRQNRFNINYDYNINTKLYALFFMLELKCRQPFPWD